MPNYDYKCPKCGLVMDVWQRSYDPTEEIECLDCHYKMTKQITAPSVHFSGSGFYGTDYKGK